MVSEKIAAARHLATVMVRSGKGALNDRTPRPIASRLLASPV